MVTGTHIREVHSQPPPATRGAHRAGHTRVSQCGAYLARRWMTTGFTGVVPRRISTALRNSVVRSTIVPKCGLRRRSTSTRSPHQVNHHRFAPCTPTERQTHANTGHRHEHDHVTSPAPSRGDVRGLPSSHHQKFTSARANRDSHATFDSAAVTSTLSVSVSVSGCMSVLGVE